MTSSGRVARSERFRPKKGLGQHFLADRRILNRMIALAGLVDSDTVLEIGPGRGALTLPLARGVRRVVAVEKDEGLIEFLRDRLTRARIDNVRLVNRDILAWDFAEIEEPAGGGRVQVIGNLPYNISSPVLEMLIRNRDRIGKAVLMFQKEVAGRLTASPGSKAYGALTLLVQYHVRPREILSVPRTAFYPRPKVDSAVVSLDFSEARPERSAGEAAFRRTVRAAFGHRRKTLVNSLASLAPPVDKKHLLDLLDRCGVDPSRRAETLSMEEFLRIAAALELTRHEGDVT